MSDDMTTKYQQHYNQVLTGTLTDTIMKSVSYQANIKLANEIIAEQEKSITDLKSQIETIQQDSKTQVNQAKQELESFKNNKANSDTVRFTTLENAIRTHQETITKLNIEVASANKLKTEYENLKNQAGNLEVFRKELIREREDHETTKQNYEKMIKELKNVLLLIKKKELKNQKINGY